MSEEVFDPQRQARKVARRHRLLTLTIGLPLAAVLFVPWRRRRDWLYVWDLPDPTVLPMVAAGAAGVLFVIAAFVPAKHRRAALAFAGLATGASGVWLLGAIPFSGSDLRRVGLFATRAWVVLAMFTAGAEMAMHRRPKSRPIALMAFSGWLGILAFFFFLPIGPELTAEQTTASQLLEHLDHSYSRIAFVAPVFAWFALVALVGLLQTLRRLGGDRELAAERFFRRSWLAWALYPAPLIAFFAFGAYMMAEHGDADELTNFTLSFALVYGTSLGGAIGVRSLLLRERERRPIPKRALIAIGAVLAIAITVLGVARIFISASEEAAAETIAWEVAEAVEQGLRGEPFDARFLGGYSELDLRNAEGIVELPEGAEPAVVAFHVSSPPATAVVRRDTPIAWVGRTDSPQYGLEAPIDVIAEADPGFAALVDALDSSGCLPALDDDALDDPATAAVFEHPPNLDPVCQGDDEPRDAERVETLGSGRSRSRGSSGATGAVERYVVVFTVPGGSPIAVAGMIRLAGGRAWIGNPTPWPASAPE